MAETQVATTDSVAIKLYSVALFAESVRKSSLMEPMTGKAPKQEQSLAKRERVQSSPAMPIVVVSDLAQTAGDRVSVDMFDLISGMPIMGDEKISGKGAPIDFSSMEVVINQTRFPINAGQRMSQKRTRHNLRKIARAGMASWFARTNDQICLIHLAGARGTEQSIDWNIPLESHDKFSEIMVNPVQPPTRNRRFIAGGGKDLSDLASTDALRLEDLDRISAALREMPLPPAPVRLQNDPMGDTDPVYILYVTTRQWHYMMQQSGDLAWRKLVQDATTRLHISKHPLFAGQTGVWNGFVIKRMARAIRWKPADSLKEYDANGAVQTRTVGAGLYIDRAILLGGQALAVARGDAGTPQGGYPMKWTEELSDHKNSLEIGAAQIDGKKKFRFKGSDGAQTDFGVMTIDSYAPDPDTALGITLANELAGR